MTSDNDSIYEIHGYNLYRNDLQSTDSRPFGGMAICSRIEFLPGYPRKHNIHGIEITIVKAMIFPHVTIIGIYRPPRISVQHLLAAVNEVLNLCTSQYNIFIGDLNINWLDEAARSPLYRFFISDHHYRQLVNNVTTDSKTLIDHIYTNLPEFHASSHILETYFSDHKAVCVLINCFQ